MKRTLFLLLSSFGLAIGLAFSQTSIRQLAPTIGPVPDVSAASQQRLQRLQHLVFLIDKGTANAAEKAEVARLSKTNDPDRESVWDVLDMGCSWYCGDGSYKEVASSALSAAHGAAKAHDLSLQYAWVEGAAGNGVGESLSYYFKNSSPRLNQINIYNGYLKTPALWQANGRVKKLKLWVNEQPYAELNLRDSPALQSFKVPLLGHRPDKKDLVLRFEILAVYAGTKYQDTALSEIFFDGIDVH